MPRVKSLSVMQRKTDEYRKKARANILKYMELANMDDKAMSVKQNVTTKTIQNRKADPGTMQLKDLWEMAIILKCPIGELCGGDMPEELIGSWMAKAMKGDTNQ